MTTTSEETNGTPKKSPRKGSKVAKRIDELEAEYAAAEASGETAEAMRLRVRINNLENGDPEEMFGGGVDATEPVATSGANAPIEPTQDAAAAAPVPSFSADLADAVANAEPEWTWEVSEEVIDVPLTDRDRSNMLRANGADEDTKAAVDREVDDLKTELKEKKAESETIAARIKDRNRSGSKETSARKAHWKVGTCFALNTLRYVDPDTGSVVKERPLTLRERQLELGVVAAPPAKDGQLAHGDAASVDPTELTSPESLLADAAKGDALPQEATLQNEPDSDDEDEESNEDEDDSDDEESE